MIFPPRCSRLGLAMIMLPLYAGPVLAGWSVLPLATIGVFAAAFALCLVATRPVDAARLGGLARLALLLAIQILLCFALYGLGILAARITGPLSVPVWLPFALTLPAALIGARVYRYKPQMDALLDDITRAIETQQRLAGETPPPPRHPPAGQDRHPAGGALVRARGDGNGPRSLCAAGG